MQANSLKAVFLVLIITASVLEVAADIFLKKWVTLNKTWFFAIGILIYFIGTIFWAFSLKYDLLSKAISVFTVINLILIVLAGVLIFNEKLSLVNKLGILLGIISLILVES